MTHTSVSFSTAFFRGMRFRCPNCGKGKLFHRFLKVSDHCTVCGEEFVHHRADDFPAYMVALLSGHSLLPLIFHLDIKYSPPYWVHLAITLPLIVILCVALLQPVKGAIIATQWYFGMHDFAPARKRREEAEQLQKQK